MFVISRIMLASSYLRRRAVCLVALMPLVKLHDMAICDLARRIGGSKAALINASLVSMMVLVGS